MDETTIISKQPHHHIQSSTTNSFDESNNNNNDYDDKSNLNTNNNNNNNTNTTTSTNCDTNNNNEITLINKETNENNTLTTPPVTPRSSSPTTATTWRASKPQQLQITLNREHTSQENLLQPPITTTQLQQHSPPSSKDSSMTDQIRTNLSTISISSDSVNSTSSNGSNNNSNSNSPSLSTSVEETNSGSWWSKFKLNTTTTTTSNNNNNQNNNNINDDDGGEVIYHSTPSSRVIKEGILNKQGHLRKNWLPRYFILTDTCLEYYREKGGPQLNSIPLFECSIELADTETKKAFCFKISHATRKTFYLLTNSSDIERSSYEWIGAIQEVIDTLNAQNQTQPNNHISVTPTLVTESHRSYELVHAISNALLYSLGKTSAAAVTDLCIEDFTTSETQNVSSKEKDGAGNKTSVSYKFIDYSPKVFRKIRELAGVNSADFMISLTTQPLTEVPTAGRSNSYFYFTGDKKYLIKTITSAEFDHLRNILTNYYFHLSQNKDTLLLRYYGLHHISPTKMKSTHFVIMENIFEDRQMDEIYDLKGSTLQRKAEAGKTVLMDLDFCTRIFVSDDIKAKFFKQIETDCSFLEKNVCMDYSLLLGIRYLNGKKVDPSDDEKVSLFKREDGGMVSRTANGELYDRIYYLAIIDILTTYGIKKQLEHTYKATIYDTKDSMSAVDPSTYNKRFKQFVHKITGWKVLQDN